MSVGVGFLIFYGFIFFSCVLGLCFFPRYKKAKQLEYLMIEWMRAHSHVGASYSRTLSRRRRR